MDTTTSPDQQIKSVHSRCFACGRDNSEGLRLVFRNASDGRVCARCTLDEQYQGYAGVVQGGIIATMLDSAMTNCLFCQSISAVTARLNVRYHEPVVVGQEMAIEAALVRHRGRIYELEAALTQGNQLKASASGRFMVTKDAL